MPVPVPTSYTAQLQGAQPERYAQAPHLLDKNSIEVFANDGEQTMTAWIYTPHLPTASPLLPMVKQQSRQNSLSWICNLIFPSFLLH